jgi:S1-C subfamily serine protease
MAVRLGERPQVGGSDEGTRKLTIDTAADAQKPFGLTVTDITPALVETYRLADGQKGVVVKEINPASYIADVKMSNGYDALSEGDLIQKINRKNVDSLKAFNEIVTKLKPGDAVVMEVLSYSRSSRSTQLKIVQFTVQ